MVIFLLSIVIFYNKTKLSSDNIINSVKIVPLKDKITKIYHGYIKAKRASVLSFNAEGRIIFLPYSTGDFVKKGQILAKLDGELYKIQKDEEIARLKEAQIQFKKSKVYFKRMDLLHSKGGISDNDRDDAYYDFMANNEKVKIQNEKIRYINKKINHNTIFAPYDGYIGEKYNDTGAYVTAGEHILDITSAKQTQAEIMVDSGVINKLYIGKNVLIRRNDNLYHGKITHISKNSTYTGGYKIIIYLSSFFKELKNGMDVNVEISFSEPNAFYIPITSVFVKNGKNYIYKIIKINNNLAQVSEKRVKTGAMTNDMIQIFSDLKNNDLVVFDADKIRFNNEKIKIQL